MKSSIVSIVRAVSLILPLLISLVSWNCSLPSYESPAPGEIQVRLHGSTNPLGIKQGPLDDFNLKVDRVQAIRSDGALLTIFADVKGIQRTVGLYNALGLDARDSNIVLGEVIAPPGDYAGFSIQIEPSKKVIIDGYQQIDVVPADNFSSALQFFKPFTVPEGGKTVIVLTIDVDKSLVKGANNYTFSPVYYISSVTH